MKSPLFLNLASFLLLVPATVVVGLGTLESLSSWAFPDRWMDALRHAPFGQWMVSPWIVLPGLILSLVLSLTRSCRVSWQTLDQWWLVTFSLARRPAPICAAGLACLMSLVILAYLVAENGLGRP